MANPLMPKATAVWLVENSSLTFELDPVDAHALVRLGGLGRDLLADHQPPEDPPIGPQKTDLRSLLKNMTIANAK